MNAISWKERRAKPEELSSLLAHELGLDSRMVYPYADSCSLLTDILKLCDSGSARLLGGGHVSASVAIAADRANLSIIEILADSPFMSDVRKLLSQIENDNDIIYLANPNRLTGASYTLSELQQVVERIPRGLLIIDEYYYDFLGVSSFPLLGLFTNVIVLRSFNPVFGLYALDAGYAVGSEDLLSRLYRHAGPQKISQSLTETFVTCLTNDTARRRSLEELRAEALRTAKELIFLGVQCRITTADFLLLRVASPRSAGNFLTRYRLEIENLSGYPMLDNYIRYRLSSSTNNDVLIDAFKRMPKAYYHLVKNETFATKLNSSPQSDRYFSDERFRSAFDEETESRFTAYSPEKDLAHKS